MKFWTRIKSFFSGTDKILFILCLFASFYGLLLVYSSGYHTLSTTLDPIVIFGFRIPNILFPMLISVVVGVFLAIIISAFDFEFLTRMWPILAVVTIALMIIVLTPLGVGPPGSNNRAWIKIAKFTFQPSELGKVIFIFTFSIHLNKVKENISHISNVILLVLHAIIPIGLVLMTKDDGSALIIVLIFIAMMFTAGLKLIYFIVGIIGSVGAFYYLWITDRIENYQKDRFLVPFNPEGSPEKVIYQQNQGLIAIGSGQMSGKGFLKGSFHQYVPESQNDFIVAVAGEEFGLIGCLVILILLFAIILRIYWISFRLKTNNEVGYFVCSGICSMIAIQTFINLGMCLRLMPVIGITLPFFSSGGSSSMCLYIGIGFALSVYRTNKNAFSLRSYDIQ